MVKFRAVLFDLDATLLPMDQERFLERYFELLTGKMSKLGYEPGEFMKVLWEGTGAMRRNDGSVTNEEAFWEVFERAYGSTGKDDRRSFEDFYRNEFMLARDACGFDPEAGRTVRMFKDAGCRLALATSPVFPETAVRTRLGWAGVDPALFERITSYENTRWCKPDPRYFCALAAELNVSPEECLMVGNDVSEDMPAAAAGMSVFLLTDNLINPGNTDISRYPRGSFPELRGYAGLPDGSGSGG